MSQEKMDKTKALADAGKEAEASEIAAPSPHQPWLDEYVTIITSLLDEEVIEESYINERSKDIPTLVVKRDAWHEVAEILHQHPDLSFEYFSELHSIDLQMEMEVYCTLYSFAKKRDIAIKTRLDREAPVVASLTDIWKGANWYEREVYDLMGIEFTNHPNLERIMLPPDWVGHPLRKDYVQYDEEV